MEIINWKEIRNWLDERAECEYEFNDIDCHARPNKEMRALTMYEDWQSKLWGVSEEDVINEVLEILEELTDRDEYEETIYKLNRRYFFLTEVRYHEQVENSPLHYKHNDKGTN